MVWKRQRTFFLRMNLTMDSLPHRTAKWRGVAPTLEIFLPSPNKQYLPNSDEQCNKNINNQQWSTNLTVFTNQPSNPANNVNYTTKEPILTSQTTNSTVLTNQPTHYNGFKLLTASSASISALFPTRNSKTWAVNGSKSVFLVLLTIWDCRTT